MQWCRNAGGAEVVQSRSWAGSELQVKVQRFSRVDSIGDCAGAEVAQLQQIAEGSAGDVLKSAEQVQSRCQGTEIRDAEVQRGAEMQGYCEVQRCKGSEC